MAETAEIFSTTLNQEVHYVQVPWDEFEDQVGEEHTTMYRWFEDEGYEADIDALRQIHPTLKDLPAFLRKANL